MTEARVHRGVGLGKGQLVSPIRLEHDRKKIMTDKPREK